MTTPTQGDGREALRRITSFAQLLEFLRNELDWPVAAEDFEEAFFDYTPEELGLDSSSAAKIKQIRRLRPLSARQPWGIYFIDFEPKRLPVVALRRILGSVVLKKRASGNPAERAAWAQDDLLFISAYGENSGRHITFAQFTDVGISRSLPTLKVLGWDSLDSALHLDQTDELLRRRLRWPDDEGDLDDWRERWRSAFAVRHREVVRTASALAETLADLARSIRDRISTILAVETADGPLTALMGAFQSALIRDLDAAEFADMYAQTIAYGLLSARIAHPGTLEAEELAAHIPLTNPFLKELLESFLVAGSESDALRLDFDELGVGEVVDLLDATDMESVLRDFGDRNPLDDPVIRFYEQFLRHYDAKQKTERGVFYTPRPVVSYIVRSVDRVLRDDFGLVDGLADTATWREVVERNVGLSVPPSAQPDQPFVRIIDPAVGTGTFLVEVVDLVYETMSAKWRAQGASNAELVAQWNSYVDDHLLSMLNGFELLMAPYAICHVKLGLKLYETGYRFGSTERAHVYLTNSLEPSEEALPDSPLLALAHEAAEVRRVKTAPFTVVLGNPPYAGHSSNNAIHWIVDLVRDYTRDEPGLAGPAQSKWLQDDYVKFLRLAEYFTARTGVGVVAMITNHRYLSNRTFRGMRKRWRDAFSMVRCLDLHGNVTVKEDSPVPLDENVFDIEQGVSIGISTRTGAPDHVVIYSELWGPRTNEERTGKYDRLTELDVATTTWEACDDLPPLHLFLPRREVHENAEAEFRGGFALTDLMPGALGPNGKPPSGLATMHDGFAISFDEGEVEAKVEALLATSTRDEAVGIFGGLCNPQQWDYARAKRVLSGDDWRHKIVRLNYSPFDYRYTVYDSAVAVHLRRRLSDHLFLRDNVAIVVGEAGQEIGGGEWDAVFCVDGLLQLNFFRRNGSPTLPLYLYDRLGGDAADGRVPNLSAELVRELVPSDGTAPNILPPSVLAYTYALLHSREYRTRYAEFLKTEFPRILRPTSGEVFEALAAVGSLLIDVHLLRSPIVNESITTVVGEPPYEVVQVTHVDSTVWLEPSRQRGIRGVTEPAWNFHVGGFQPCQKWLKDRQAKRGKNPRAGLILSDDDIRHYQRIVRAISETRTLSSRVDEVVREHGGWRNAFRYD